MQKTSIFVVGDSISLDYGPSLERSLLPGIAYGRKSGEDLARRNLDDPAGANGGDSGMVLRYLEALAPDAAFAPDLLLVNAGLHDLKRHATERTPQVDLGRYRANLIAITVLASRRGWRLAWVRTTAVIDSLHNRSTMGFHRFAADVEAWNAEADRVMQEARIPVADLLGFTAGLGDLPALFRDHVHYQPEVCRAQGQWLGGWVSGLLAQPR